MEKVIVFALGTAFFLALRDILGRLAMQGIDPVLGTADPDRVEPGAGQPSAVKSEISSLV